MRRALIALGAAVVVAACGHTVDPQAAGSNDASGAPLNAPSAVVRRGFLGAFFRPQGNPPFGVFSVDSDGQAPDPYPTPGTKLFGPGGYCDAPDDSGTSITSGYLVDKAKLQNVIDLGVKWTRTEPSPFLDDTSHILDHFSFGDLDSAECALLRHHIVPIIGLLAGPVQYNASEDHLSAYTEPTYKTPADFASWCRAVTRHETQIFTPVTRYSLPGNEVNSNPTLFPDGDAEIARYAEACYHAVKSVAPHAFVYGLELNMDGHLDPAGTVRHLYQLGCKVGTCYDGLSIHLSLRYPIPPPNTPCYPNPGGDYAMQCIADIQAAAHAPIHVLIGETGYFVPKTVPNEATKAAAVVAELNAYAANPYVDGVNYANVDECDLYPSGYFAGGCIVDSVGQRLPAYTALKSQAAKQF